MKKSVFICLLKSQQRKENMKMPTDAMTKIVITVTRCIKLGFLHLELSQPFEFCDR